MKYVLTVLEGSLKGERRRIQRRTIAVGRDLSCQLWLTDEGVAPRHAEFEVREGSVYVRALDLTAPVRVGNLEVREARLNEGDFIDLGSVRLRYERQRLRPLHVLTFLLVAGLAGTGTVVAGVRIFNLWFPPEKGADAVPVVADIPVPPPPSGSREVGRMEHLSRSLEGPAAPPAAALTNPPAPPAALTGAVAGAVAAAPPAALPAAAPAPAAGTESAAGAGTQARFGNAARGLAEAQALLARGETRAADELLARIQKESPDFLPAYAERARLLERMGHPDLAEQQWTQLLHRGNGDTLYEAAAAELMRLAKLQLGPPVATPVARTVSIEAPPEAPVLNLIKPPAPPPPVPAPVPAPAPVAEAAPPAAVATAQVAAATSPPRAPAPATLSPFRQPVPYARPAAPTNPPAAPQPPPAVVRPAVTAAPPPVAVAAAEPAARPAPAVRLAGIQHHRMPASPDSDDTRLLRITVAPSATWIRPDHVTVEVMFFDQWDKTGAPFPSRALVTANPLRLPAGNWKDGAPRELTATYSIPKGQREKERLSPTGMAHYYGYRVRVYYDGRLQTQDAKPPDLNR